MPAGSEFLDAKEFLKSIGLEQGECLADFGCGRSGHMVFPASHMVGPDGLVHAVDVNKNVLAQLAGHAPHVKASINTVWGDMEKSGGVEIDNDSVDHVVCVNNLWCIKNHKNLFSEMQRVAKPGGYGYLIDYRKNSSHPVAPNVSERFKVESVIDLLAEQGIESEIIPVGRHHWGLRLIF